MKFISGISLPATIIDGTTYIINDSINGSRGWDDYGFESTFHLYIGIKAGAAKIGILKIIGSSSENFSEVGRTKLPDSFDQLPEQYCSLGQNQAFYESIYELKDQGKEILKALNDIVLNRIDVRPFKKYTHQSHYNPFDSSLLRDISIFEIKHKFRPILNGQTPKTKFSLKYENADATEENENFSLNFNVDPDHFPSSNLHALIGRNAVGKTYTLKGIVSAALGLSGDDYFGRPLSLRSEVSDKREYGAISNVVYIAFSPFDDPEEILIERPIKARLGYSYVGLLERFKNDDDVRYRIKNDSTLLREFLESYELCRSVALEPILKSCLEELATDPIFEDLRERLLLPQDHDLSQLFKKLSSGHKVVLLTILKLIPLAQSYSLVVIDEPENHLHPPLLSALIRSIIWLLQNRNALALVATHSPVVLQEIRSDCVYILQRSGHYSKAERPDIQTFGENVGVLTRAVFKHDIEKSSFYNLIRKESVGKSYKQLLENIDGGSDGLGSEGRLFARLMTAENKD